MKNNDVVSGTVKSIRSTHILVETENNKIGLLHISKVSDYYVRDLSTIFEVNNSYEFAILGHDESGKLRLGWKSIYPRFKRNPFKFSIKETEKGFETLKNNLERGVEND